MAYLQAANAERTVRLTLAGTPVPGIPFTSVTAKIKKQGQTSFSIYTLSTATWHDLGGGLYSIVFTPTLTDTLGDFTYTLTSSSFDNFTFDQFTIEPAPPPAIPSALPTQCIVSGNVANLSGNPPTSEPLKIVAYLPEFPAKVGSTVLVGDRPYTFADANGNFSLPLVRNSTVIIEIKRAGIRAQIAIPDAPTANLTDLLPPFVADYSL